MAQVPLLAERPRNTRSSSGSKKRPYEIVFESISQEKKKLVTMDSKDVIPPEGFTFVQAGLPEVTKRCKEYSRIKGYKAYIVSTTLRRDQASLQLCRIGYHFSSTVVSRVCDELQLFITPTGRVCDFRGYNMNGVMENDEAFDLRYLDRRKSGHGKNVDNHHITQDQLDSAAWAALFDLFPKMPDKDRHAIITHAFKKGTNRVGIAHDMPLQYRANLATVAHIRHTYTPYDKLLRTKPQPEARANVREACWKKVAEWRGDNKEDDGGMENILREVIVIPDDDEDNEDEENDSDKESEARRGREGSVEFISSRPIVQELNDIQMSQECPVSEYQVHPGDMAILDGIEMIPRIPEAKSRKKQRLSSKWGDRYREERQKNKRDSSGMELCRPNPSPRGQRDSHYDDHNSRPGNTLQDYPSHIEWQHHPSELATLMRNKSPGPYGEFARTKSRDQHTHHQDSQVWSENDIIMQEQTADIIHRGSVSTNVPASNTRRFAYVDLSRGHPLSPSHEQRDVFADPRRATGRTTKRLSGTRQDHNMRFSQDYSLEQRADNWHDSVSTSMLVKESYMPSLCTPRMHAVPQSVEPNYDREPLNHKRRKHDSTHNIIDQGTRLVQCANGASAVTSSPPEQQMRRYTSMQLDLKSTTPKILRQSSLSKDPLSPREHSGPHHHDSYVSPNTPQERLSRSYAPAGIDQLQRRSSNILEHANTRGAAVPQSRKGFSGVHVQGNSTVTARGGHPVYVPQDGHLERTSSFHHSVGSHEDRPFESRHFLPMSGEHVNDGHMPRDEISNFGAQSSQSSNGLSKPHSDAQASCDFSQRSSALGMFPPQGEDRMSYDGKFQRNVETTRVSISQYVTGYSPQDGALGHGKYGTLLPNPRLDEPQKIGLPGANIPEQTRVADHAYRPTEVDLPHHGRVRPKDKRRESRDWLEKADRYNRESGRPIYVEQLSGDFALTDVKKSGLRDRRRNPFPNEEIIVLDD